MSNFDDEITKLTELRDYLTYRLDQLRKAKKKQEEEQQVKEKNEVLYVQTECLTPYVKEAIDSGQFNLTSLAIDAVVAARTIGNIYNNKTEWTEDRVADSIMQSLGLPHVFHSFTFVRLTRKMVLRQSPQSHYYEE